MPASLDHPAERAASVVGQESDCRHLATYDDIALGLQGLRAAAGQLSYADIVVRIGRIRRDREDGSAVRPARTTVYDAFRTGRKRVNPVLVGDIVHALTGDATLGDEWRDRCSVVRAAAERSARPTGSAGGAPTPESDVPAEPAGGGDDPVRPGPVVAGIATPSAAAGAVPTIDVDVPGQPLIRTPAGPVTDEPARAEPSVAQVPPPDLPLDEGRGSGHRHGVDAGPAVAATVLLEADGGPGRAQEGAPTSRAPRPEPVAARPLGGGRTFLLLVVAVLMNLLGSAASTFFALPVYLDMVWTCLTAIVLGPWAGVLVGVTTNVAAIAYDGSASIPFALVQVAGALVWGYGVRRLGLGRSLGRLLGLNLAVALVCTLVATPIIVGVFGGQPFVDQFPLSARLREIMGAYLPSVLGANLFYSLVDKLVAGFVAVGIITAVPSWRAACTGVLLPPPVPGERPAVPPAAA